MHIKYDTHLHTSFSLDSETPMSDQIKRAISLGFKGLCFTDHIDYGFPKDQCPPEFEGLPFLFDMDEYKSEIKTCIDNYPEIEIKTGVECGLQTDEAVIASNKKLCSDSDLDQVIGSIHLIDKQDPYYPAFWEGKTVYEVMSRYFELTLINLKAFSDINTLGHMDYAARYAIKYIDGQKDFKPTDYFEITDEVMKYLISKDIALEVNTSPLKKGLGTINPHPDFLVRYKELGGQLITIGSDAHTTDALGYGFDQAFDILTNIGFDEYVTYDKRKPVSHKLVIE